MDSLVNYTEPNYIGRFAHESAYVGQGACLIDDTHLIRYAQKSGTDKGLVDIADLNKKTISRKGTTFN
jgi:hypothetical protein